MSNRIIGSKASGHETFTVTATLLVARLAEDNAIELHIAGPADPSTTRRVTLAAGSSEPHGQRMRRAREAFIDTIGSPSFEGFMLLYGKARLTLVAAGPRLHVLDFVALDSVAPSPYARHTLAPRGHARMPSAAHRSGHWQRFSLMSRARGRRGHFSRHAA